MSNDNDGKILGIPDTFKVLHTDMANDDVGAGVPSVTLRAVRSGERIDYTLSPDAARELAQELRNGADFAEAD